MSTTSLLRSPRTFFSLLKHTKAISFNASNAAFKTPSVSNEPNKHYAPGSDERRALLAHLPEYKTRVSSQQASQILGGKPFTSSQTFTQRDPSNHSTNVGTFSLASAKDVTTAITSAMAARSSWAATPFADRAAIFLKAADLISTKYRYEIMAATMLGQGKTAWQADIDCVAELCDFLRFNVHYAEQMYASQPVHNSPGVWNRLDYRSLEGFVYAVSPFNFTAIGGNLPCAPALMGNVVIWKPSYNALASNLLIYNILLEAGLPSEVIQFVPGDPLEVTKRVLEDPNFASLHFTGSTSVFRALYGQIALGVVEQKFKSYPRIVGETGGKNFHLIHSSADIPNAVYQTVRGAFEYQGQKCSATSRVYVPESRAQEFIDMLVAETEKLSMGSVTDMTNFVGPVIHEASFHKLSRVIEDSKSDKHATVLTGGKCDASTGYFVTPTIYRVSELNHRLLSEELFGPVLTVHVYQDSNLRPVMQNIDHKSKYALTGSIFASDRKIVRYAEEVLRNAAGNFYINCKSTGAVVGQQPFGGARASGTNDKAGSGNLLSRFVSVRSIKEEFVGIGGWKYPSNEKEVDSPVTIE